MYSNFYLCFFLILHVQTVSTFEFKKCNDKPLLIVENGVAKMGCTTDDWFGYCTLINKKTLQSCTIEISYYSYVTKQSDCDHDKRIDFAGNVGQHTCIFTIKDVHNSGM